MTDFLNTLTDTQMNTLIGVSVLLFVTVLVVFFDWVPGSKVSDVRHYDDHVKGRCGEQRRFVWIGGREYHGEVRNISYERDAVWSEWRWASTRYADSIHELNF